MLSRLCSFFDEIHITQVQNERSAKIEELLEITRELNIKDFPEPDPLAFIKKFKERKSNDCLVVLGSMYLIGEIKSEMQKYKIA
jgi:folylpolyglutamate synthase/dihydropteroate synthase